MCGIIGYTGGTGSVDRLIEGLHALEYRGYDSAGVAVVDEDGRLHVVKASGRLKNIEEKLSHRDDLRTSRCGIGHTRWATHGAPTDVNSHPHGTTSLQLVHNGIIENYLPLKEKLQSLSYSFESETDTDVAAKLLDYHYRTTGDHLTAIRRTVGEIVGSYALGIIFSDAPGRIYAVKKDSPLIVGCGKGENYIASDITAILRYTNKYYQLDPYEIAVVEKDQITIFDLDGNPITKPVKYATWDVQAAERGGFPHFMIKEIHEEPDALKKTLSPRIKNGLPDFSSEQVDDTILKSVSRMHIVACGTAMHAGLYGKALFERLAGIPVTVEIASEFRYNNPIIGPGDLVIIISQSGETADSLAALRLAKEKGAHTLAIVNVVGSSIAREADQVIFTWAGPEIAVASTKAYTVQTALIALLAVKTAYLRGKLDEAETRRLMAELSDGVSKAVAEVIARQDEIRAIAKTYKDCEHLFFIGRGIDYCAAQEGSLKLKEISYIHSEAYAAGELKHGTISLVTDGVPVIALATINALYEKTLNNIKEVKARGGRVLLVCTPSTQAAATECDHLFVLPEVPELFALIPAVTALQLLAYFCSVERGCDVDKPRNLAKSVTVE